MDNTHFMKENGREAWTLSTFISACLIAISILMSSIFKLFDTKPIWMVVCTALVILSVVISYKELFRATHKGLTKVVFTIIGLWIWCVFLAVIQGAEKPLRLEVLERLIYVIILTFMLCKLKLPLLPLKVCLYLILAFFYYQYFILNITSYGINGAESGAVNTVVLLSVSITIQVLDYRDNHAIALLPSILIVPIAAMSWNRTGFIVSLLYVVTVFFIGNSHIKKKNNRYFFFFLSIAVLALLVVRYYGWFSETSIYSKFESNALDNTARSTIWASYFSTFGLVQFIIGRAIDNSHPLIDGFINPHNSYIMLHSQVGVLAVIFFVVMIKRFWLYFKKDKFVFFMFLVLFVRGFFDMAFFFQPFDYAIFLFMFDCKRLIAHPKDINVRFV